jgi:hypothetical protein
VKLNKKLIDICYRLIENKELCKLIANDSTNPYGGSDIQNPENLINNRILPYYSNLETITDSRTVLSIYFDNIRGKPPIFNGVTLNFMVLAHESLKIIEGGARVYEIVDVLLESFDKLSGLGLGEIEFDIGRIYVPNKDYDGMILSFKITDFK